MTAESSGNPGAEKRGPSTRKVDAVVAFIMAGVGVVVIVNSLQVGAG
jgi:hypothetical protein